MKNKIITGALTLALSMGFVSCGKEFLETKYYKGVDVETGLASADNVNTALTGVYYNLYTRYFAGNYATTIGDIPTDISYWNTKTGHWDDIYQFTVEETDSYLSYIWEYGYKIVDNSARIIVACDNLYNDATESDKQTLDACRAEAYALRAYANLAMVNVFGHQIKVNGNDFSSKPGIVISETPIPAFSEVKRATVGETYTMIVNDLNNALKYFKAAGGDRGDKCYIGVAATEGLLARTYLYMENWDAAISSAEAALEDGGKPALAYTNADYKALYNGGSSNTESFFYLDINASQNWSANSCGTLWTSYNFSPSPKLLAMYGAKDVRNAIMGMDAKSSTATVPVFAGGKFASYGSGNPAHATNYLVNAPEMYLIMAEGYIKKNDVANAQKALLNVAKRNTSIATTDDLPATATELYAFLKDERARELFQEGLRLYDLRRWGDPAQVEAYNAPQVLFRANNYNISEFVFPIPVDEINANFGVTQNEGWSDNLPK